MCAVETEDDCFRYTWAVSGLVSKHFFRYRYRTDAGGIGRYRVPDASIGLTLIITVLHLSKKFMQQMVRSNPTLRAEPAENQYLQSLVVSKNSKTMTSRSVSIFISDVHNIHFNGRSFLSQWTPFRLFLTCLFLYKLSHNTTCANIACKHGCLQVPANERSANKQVTQSVLLRHQVKYCHCFSLISSGCHVQTKA